MHFISAANFSLAWIILLENTLFWRQNARLKIAYSAQNSAGSLRLKALEFAAFVIRVWENTT